MSKQNTDDNDDNSDSFDATLKVLYALSLLDEDFQQQQLADLRQVPEEKRALLNPTAKDFISPPESSAALRQRIFAELEQQRVTKPTQTVRSGWAKLFSWQGIAFSFLSPAVIAPIACAFGIFLGFILLPATNTPLTVEGEDSVVTVTRDSGITTSIGMQVSTNDSENTISTSTDALVKFNVDNSINDEDRVATRGTVNTRSIQSHKDNAEKWLEYIIPLLKEGEVAEAIIELEQFRKRYPNYKSSED